MPYIHKNLWNRMENCVVYLPLGIPGGFSYENKNNAK